MKFLLVNDRKASGDAYCAYCTGSLQDNYLRELGTRIRYCDADCYSAHCKVAVYSLDATKLLTYQVEG